MHRLATIGLLCVAGLAFYATSWAQPGNNMSPPQLSYEDSPSSPVPITFDEKEKYEEVAVVIRSRAELLYWSKHRALAPGDPTQLEKELEVALAKALKVDSIDWTKKMVVAAVPRYHRWEGTYTFAPPKLEGETLIVSWEFKENPDVQKTFRYTAVALIDRHDGPVAFKPISAKLGHVPVALSRSGSTKPALPSLDMLAGIAAGEKKIPARATTAGTLAVLPFTLPESKGHGIDTVTCDSSNRDVVTPIEIVRGQPGDRDKTVPGGVSVLLKAHKPGKVRLTVRVKYTVFVEPPVVVELEVR